MDKKGEKEMTLRQKGKEKHKKERGKREEAAEKPLDKSLRILPKLIDRLHNRMTLSKELQLMHPETHKRTLHSIGVSYKIFSSNKMTSKKLQLGNPRRAREAYLCQRKCHT
jgi:hypothetical protein